MPLLLPLQLPLPVIHNDPMHNFSMNHSLFFPDMSFCVGFLSNNSCDNCAMVKSIETLGMESVSRPLHWGDEVQTEPKPRRSKNHCFFLFDVPVTEESRWSNSWLSCAFFKEAVIRGNNLNCGCDDCNNCDSCNMPILPALIISWWHFFFTCSSSTACIFLRLFELFSSAIALAAEATWFIGLFICDGILPIFWLIHWRAAGLFIGLFICDRLFSIFWLIHWRAAGLFIALLFICDDIFWFICIRFICIWFICIWFIQGIAAGFIRWLICVVLFDTFWIIQGGITAFIFIGIFICGVLLLLPIPPGVKLFIW